MTTLEHHQIKYKGMSNHTLDISTDFLTKNQAYKKAYLSLSSSLSKPRLRSSCQAGHQAGGQGGQWKALPGFGIAVLR
jgi:hypothetical protein